MNVKKLLKTVLSLLLAIISIFVLARYATSTDFHAKTIEALDDKKKTVMELTAASTAASAAITLIPGDVATPIADKLADLTSYFLLVICAIYLEKYLLTITGYAAFVILIPIACVLFSINVWTKSEAIRQLVAKLLVFGMALFLVVPASVKVSDMIESTYQSSIEQTINAANETVDEIEGLKEESEEDNAAEKKTSFWNKIKDNLEDTSEKIKDKIINAGVDVENVLNNFIEALAVMIVTSCVIPIVVMLFFVWLVKVILGVNIPLPQKRNSEV